MKKISLIILFISFLINTIYSQDNSVENEEILEVTFTKGFNSDTVSFSINDYLIIDRNIAESDFSDGVTSLELYFSIENDSVKVNVFRGNQYVVPYTDSIFNFKIQINQLVKYMKINYKKGKFLLIENARNKILYKQTNIRPKFF